jgi:hypothetical protein
MPILKWNTAPAGTQEDRRAHVVGHGDGVSLVHAVSGEKVQGQGQINTLGPNIELATKWSTAPYRGSQSPDTPAPSPPTNVWGYRAPERENHCMAHNDTCNGWATKSSDRQWCIFHTPKKSSADADPIEPNN